MKRTIGPYGNVTFINEGLSDRFKDESENDLDSNHDLQLRKNLSTYDMMAEYSYAKTDCRRYATW